jgi:putative DNA methylase
MQVPSATKQKKAVALAVLFCPACEAVWQWRGPLPEGEVTCPSCRYNYDLKKGSVPHKGKFQCSCGQTDDIIASIRTLAQDQRLPIRPYAVQAYLPLAQDRTKDDRQASFFEDGNNERLNHRHQPDNLELPDGLKGNGFLIPDNGKFFKRFTVADMRQLQQAETLWSQYQGRLPYPKSAIQRGAETNRLLEHHYNNWLTCLRSAKCLPLLH